MEAPAPRIAVVLAAALLGFLAVMAATQQPGAPRELRRFELADLVEAENAKVRSLRVELAGMRAEIEELEQGGGDAGGLRDEIRELEATGGPGAVRGPGLVVTLDDSSSPRSPSGDPNDLVVHEADIQTVVNALWGAGAEVVALNGERLTSVSAVRCAGNTLLLHGTLHSPPYRIAAIGNPQGLAASLGRQPGMERIRAEADAFGLGFEVETTDIELSGGPPARELFVAAPVSS